jgi:hypothetical protein
VAERAGLLNRYTSLNLYRGFESLPLRKLFNARFIGHFCFEALPILLEQGGKTKMEVSEANGIEQI